MLSIGSLSRVDNLKNTALANAVSLRLTHVCVTCVCPVTHSSYSLSTFFMDIPEKMDTLNIFIVVYKNKNK